MQEDVLRWWGGCRNVGWVYIKGEKHEKTKFYGKSLVEREAGHVQGGQYGACHMHVGDKV